MQLHSMLASAAVAARTLRRGGELPAAREEAAPSTGRSRFSQGLGVLRVLAREHAQAGVGGELALILRLARHEWEHATPAELVMLIRHAEARGAALGAAVLEAEIAATLVAVAGPLAGEAGELLTREEGCERLGEAMVWLAGARAREDELSMPWERGVLELVIEEGRGLEREAWEVYQALVPGRLRETGSTRAGSLVARSVLAELGGIAEAAVRV